MRDHVVMIIWSQKIFWSEITEIEGVITGTGVMITPWRLLEWARYLHASIAPNNTSLKKDKILVIIKSLQYLVNNKRYSNLQ